MKRFAALFTFITISISTFAQIAETITTEEIPSPYRIHKHELGFGIIGGGDVRQNFWTLPGLTYRYFLPNGAIRVLVGGTLNQNSNNTGGTVYDNSEYGFVSRIGYQYHVMLGRFMPRIGCDVSTGVYNETFKDSWTYESNNTSFAVGLSPNIGIEFWFSPKFSMGLETRFDVAYRNFTSKNVQQDWFTGQPISTTTKSAGINTTVGPISAFTFGFHF